MAEQVGLTATLRFNAGAAVSQMRKTTGAFAQMRVGMTKVKAGMAKISSGFAGARIAGLALAGGIAKSVKDFADFDFQMTKAISLTKDGAENIDRLTGFAKKMGAETFFTSKQAAEGIEVLARTGLKTTDIMAALPKVLQLAAAEGLDLARASEIVTKSGNQFGISMQNAGSIADTFAFVSKNTATNVNDLAEGMRYVGTKAGRGMNISMQQTVGVLGLLANVAADASVGGTTLNNALIKLGKNAKRGTVRVGKMKAQIVKTFDPKTGKQGVDLVETMKNVATAAASIKDPVKRSAALTKLLGIRGEKASLAFAAAFGPKKLAETTAFLTKLQTNTKGAAKSLADAQIGTVTGQFKIFKSALSAVSIAVGQMILKNTPLVSSMQRVTKVLGDAAAAMSILSNPARGHAGIAAQNAKLSKLGDTGVQVAKGLKEGFTAVKEVFGTVKDAIVGVASIFNKDIGGGALKDQIRMVAKTIAWAVALKGVGGALGRVKNIAQGTFSVIKGGLSVAMSATGGIARVLGKSSPIMAKVAAKLPGIAGKLAGAMTGAEKLTAQPVRVVNTDEFGGGLGGALGGTGGAGGAGKGKGLISGAGGLIKKLALATGGIKNLALRLGAKGGLVAAAGAAGFALGTLIDKTFGLSDKISTHLFEKNKGMLQKIARAKLIKGDMSQKASELRLRAQQFKALKAKGITQVTGSSGKKMSLEEAFKAQAAQKLKGSGVDASVLIKELSKDIATTQARNNAALAAQLDKPFEVVVKMDAKEIARAMAKRKEQQGQRLGKKDKPGDKKKRRVR